MLLKNAKNFLFPGNADKERPIAVVPKWVMVVLGISILTQIVFHGRTVELQVRERPLPDPPSVETLNVLSLGDRIGLSKFLMLWLQGFDHQPGISIPFSRLNYDVLIHWLDSISTLDNESHYALLSASRIYSEVPDEEKRRKILDFVYKKFLDSPDKRWVWMAHAIYVARHKIKDNRLALHYAQQLRVHTTSGVVPNWARQLELFVYEDLGELETAQILLGGLIESGEITDENEIAFLLSRLQETSDETTDEQN